MKNPLVQKYGTARRWVNWALETRKGKTTKVPYAPQAIKKMASSTDAKTWGMYTDAVAKDSKHIGITFAPDMLLLGIDIDHCLNALGHVEHENGPAIERLLLDADTYTEVSPSGNGLHLYLALTAPLKLIANKKAPFECYTAGRYFTVTQKSWHTTPVSVRTITPDEALAILAVAGYPWGKETKAKDPFAPENEAVGSQTTKYLEPIPDDELLERMFGASNGADIKALYDGDLSKYGNDASKADMALLAHFSFWTNKNSKQMEDLWLASPLGSREKTKTREDYRVRTIKAAIVHCKDGFMPWDRTPEAIELDLLSIGKGKTKKFPLNTENICRVLRRHHEYKDTLRFDTYRNVAERKVGGKWRPITDTDAIDIQTRVSILFPQFTTVSKNMCWDALMKVVEEHTYDSAVDYVKGITWDKVPRLDTWLHKVYGTPDDNLHRSIGSNVLKGLVHRIIEPGCKFDYVLVLEGEQGIRKSSSLAILAGPLGHVETTMSTDTKDFFLQFQGNAIIEFSEGETLSRTEVKRMKAIITVQSDKYRPPYGRTSVDNPRRCIFAMTTNQTEYLKDETGNRRWLPVSVVKLADTDWLAANRDQLYAEAYHRLVVKKETTYEFPIDDVTAAQNLRRIHDPNADRIIDWYFNQAESGRQEGITATQVFQFALNAGFLSRPLTRIEEMSIADVLKSVLLLDRRRGMVRNSRAWRWYPTEKTVELGAAIAAVPLNF